MEMNSGLHKIEVPTPFPVGDVNCYLIEGNPLTLIDTGPRTDEAYACLENGVRGVGYSLGEIRQIVLTHGHVDHTGLAAAISRDGIAKVGKPPQVFIHSADGERVATYEDFMEFRVGSYLEMITLGGVPPEEQPSIPRKALTEYYLRFGESVPEVALLKEGDTISTGIGVLETLWTPGHSSGSSCFLCKESEIMFSGDHILATISSNPSLDYEDQEQIPMLRYFDSLSKAEEYRGLLALPGHRDPIHDISARIEVLRQEYTEKFDQMRTFLTKKPQTLYRLSRQLYGDYDQSSLVLALAETYDVLKILSRDGAATVESIDGVVNAKTP
jgi:glyoxylase-like metal-dependent hydrolase (beta-lactamase superfamily II)